MHCPECGIEYRPGFTECSDCQVPLVAENPLDNEVPGNPDLALVTVLEDNDPLVIAAAKSVLEEADIPFFVSGEEVGVRLETIGAFIHPLCRIQVGEDRAEEARSLLRELLEK